MRRILAYALIAACSSKKETPPDPPPEPKPEQPLREAVANKDILALVYDYIAAQACDKALHHFSGIKDRARNGRSVEVVGTYNPRTNPATVELKRDRIAYWTGNGAQLSERVGKLLAAAPAQAEAAPAA